MRILYLTGLRPRCLRGRGAGRYWTGAVARVRGSGWGAGPCVWCPSRGWNPLRSSGNIKDLGLRPGKIWSRELPQPALRPGSGAASLTPFVLRNHWIETIHLPETTLVICTVQQLAACAVHTCPHCLIPERLHHRKQKPHTCWPSVPPVAATGCLCGVDASGYCI